MAISYPLTIPNQEFASMSMRLVRTTGFSESPFTYNQQVYQHSGAQWQAEVTLPPLTYAQAREWEAFFISLRGRRGTFLMGNPLVTAPQGTVSTAVLSGAASANDTSITVDGMTSGDTILAGDYFQLDNHLYMAVEDTTFTTSGDIVFEPPLKAAQADDTALTLANPKGLWRMTSDQFGWNINNASIYGFTFACVEAN